MIRLICREMDKLDGPLRDSRLIFKSWKLEEERSCAGIERLTREKKRRRYEEEKVSILSPIPGNHRWIHNFQAAESKIFHNGRVSRRIILIRGGKKVPKVSRIISLRFLRVASNASAVIFIDSVVEYSLLSSLSRSCRILIIATFLN